MAKVIFREVPKEPGPTGEIGVDLWHAICDYLTEDWNSNQEMYLEKGKDVAWLMGYAAGTLSQEVKIEVFALIRAIESLGQVQIVWVN